MIICHFKLDYVQKLKSLKNISKMGKISQRNLIILLNSEKNNNYIDFKR